MRLYQSPDGVWTGTQADAKAYAKSTGQRWAEVEVPTDKTGLMAFLNEHRVGAQKKPELASALPEASAPPPPPLAAAPTVPQAIASIPLEEAIFELPLDEAVRLAGVMMERIREFAKNA